MRGLDMSAYVGKSPCAWGKVHVHGENRQKEWSDTRDNLSFSPSTFVSDTFVSNFKGDSLCLDPPPPPPPHTHTHFLLLFWDSFCVCIEETSYTGHCWHCPSDCSLNHSQGIFMRWDHQVEMERRLLGVQIRCKTTSLQAFIIFCTPASLLIWSGTCHDQTRLTKNCPYKDIYLPVTLKCSQECVFVTFHQYSTLT